MHERNEENDLSHLGLNNGLPMWYWQNLWCLSVEILHIILKFWTNKCLRN